MKAQFETPEVKILAFLPEDIITLSVNGSYYPDQSEGEGDGVDWGTLQ